MIFKVKSKAYKRIFTVLSAVIIMSAAVLFGLFFAAGRTYAAEPITGEIKNIVVFVNFKDKEEIEGYKIQTMQEMYNTADFSVRNYFSKVSRGKVDLESVFLNNETEGFEITLDNTENYYKPRWTYNVSRGKYVEINSQGYDNRTFRNGNAVAPETNGASEHVDGYYKEQAMIREILEKSVNKWTELNLDCNGDNCVDSFTVIINSGVMDSSDWGSLLWPHMTSLNNDARAIRSYYYVPNGYSLDEITASYPTLNGKTVNDYDLLSLGEIFRTQLSIDDNYGDVGVLCHELMHTLGAMDYYSYTDQSHETLGELDIMGSTSSMPQYPSVYVRKKMGWINNSNIAEIKNSGTYRIYPATDEKDILAYKIDLGYKTGEYFLIEARSNKGQTFDSFLSDSGVIIYRINEKQGYIGPSGYLGDIYYGNMYGDEVYAFRFGGGESVVKKTGSAFNTQNNSLAMLNDKVIKSSGIFSSETIYKNSFGSLTGKTNTICYTDGTNSKLVVTVKSVNGDGSFDFHVSFAGNSDSGVYGTTVSEPDVYYVGENEVGVSFSAEDFGNKVQFVFSDKALTRNEFDGIADKQSLTLILPYKKYSFNFENVDLNGKRYICYLADKGGVYERYGFIEFDGGAKFGNKDLDSFGAVQFDGEPKITYAGGVSWELGKDGYLVVCLIKEGENYLSAETLIENCYEFYSCKLSEKSLSIGELPEGYTACLFAVTKEGITEVYKFKPEDGNKTRIGCECFSLEFSVSSAAVMLTVLSAAFLLRNRKK